MKTIRTFDHSIVIIFSKREAERYAGLLMNAHPDKTHKAMLNKLQTELECNGLDPLDYGWEQGQ